MKTEWAWGIVVVAITSAGCAHVGGLTHDSLAESVDTRSLAPPQTAKFAGAGANAPAQLAETPRPNHPRNDPPKADLPPVPPPPVATGVAASAPAIKRPEVMPSPSTPKVESAAEPKDAGASNPPLLAQKIKTSKSTSGPTPLASLASVPPPLQSIEETSDQTREPILDDAVKTASAEFALAPVSVPVPAPMEVVDDRSADAPPNSPAAVVRVPRAVSSSPGTPRPLCLENGIALTGTSEIDSAVLVEFLSRQSEGRVDEAASGLMPAVAAPKPTSVGVVPAVAKGDEAEGAVVPVSAAVPQAPAAESAPLALRRLHLCSEILGFARTSPRSVEGLIPGERLLAYVEVTGFKSVEKEAMYETSLHGVIVLENSAGKVVYSQDFGDIVDQSVSPRRDFFCHFLLTLPAEMEPGSYRLGLTLTDRASGQTAEQQIEVTVTGSGERPSTPGSGERPSTPGSAHHSVTKKQVDKPTEAGSPPRPMPAPLQEGSSS